MIKFRYYAKDFKSILILLLTACMLCGFKNSEHQSKRFSFSALRQVLNHAEAGEVSYMHGAAMLYLVSQELGVDYLKALGWRQKAANAINIPMYSLNPTRAINDELTQQLISAHNGIFEEKVLKLEVAMISFLQPYNSGLGQNFSAYLGREENNLSDNRPMLNNNGSASTEYCQLDIENQIALLLFLYSPTKSEVVVVDIGSGWGACTKQLALLGFKVYSVDLEQRHLDFQKDNFCNMPANDTFLYQYWKVSKPEMLDNKSFKKYCKEIQGKNIVYVAGNISNSAIMQKINKWQWDIVLALDSLQFMNEKERDTVFNLVNQRLKNTGTFIIKQNVKKITTEESLMRQENH